MAVIEKIRMESNGPVAMTTGHTFGRNNANITERPAHMLRILGSSRMDIYRLAGPKEMGAMAL